jgi:protein disulfide-isomerase
MRTAYLTILTLVMLTGTTFATAAASDRLDWHTDPQVARELAVESGLPILMNFTGSDWCKWCIKLDQEVFSQPEFIDYANDNLVLLKLDFPRRTPQPLAEQKRNEQYARQYMVRGFPTIMLTNPDGSVIAQTGYQQGGAGNYIRHLEGLLP